MLYLNLAPAMRTVHYSANLPLARVGTHVWHTKLVCQYNITDPSKLQRHSALDSTVKQGNIKRIRAVSHRLPHTKYP